jgi:hypothetical protein
MRKLNLMISEDLSKFRSLISPGNQDGEIQMMEEEEEEVKMRHLGRLCLLGAIKDVEEI